MEGEPGRPVVVGDTLVGVPVVAGETAIPVVVAVLEWAGALFGTPFPALIPPVLAWPAVVAGELVELPADVVPVEAVVPCDATSDCPTVEPCT